MQFSKRLIEAAREHWDDHCYPRTSKTRTVSVWLCERQLHFAIRIYPKFLLWLSENDMIFEEQRGNQSHPP